MNRYKISDVVQDGMTVIVEDDEGGWVRFQDLPELMRATLNNMGYEAYPNKNLDEIDMSILSQIELHEAQEDMIRQGMDYEQVDLVDTLQDKYGGLRALARHSGYSTTYLCQIRKGMMLISQSAYKRLKEM